MQTRALLCAPLRTRSGNIGVIEVVNPGEGRLGRNDLDFLDALASEIGVAYEKAALYSELEREVVDLRRFCACAGGGCPCLASLVGVAAAFFHRARVLPWSELPTQRGVLLGRCASSSARCSSPSEGLDYLDARAAHAGRSDPRRRASAALAIAAAFRGDASVPCGDRVARSVRCGLVTPVEQAHARRERLR